MIKKILFWLFAFAISVMIQTFGLAQQGTAFMVIHLSVFVLGIIGAIFNIDEFDYYGFRMIAVLVLQLLGSWIFTKIFNLDYLTAYQIIAFGISLGD